MGIGRSYRLHVCPRPEQHFKVPSRYVEHMVKFFDFVPESCTVGQDGDTDMMYGKTPVTPLNIGLELLLVSRQLYHEARLKPFTEISFHYNARHIGHIDAFSRLLDQMSPPQRQAIACLRLIVEHRHDSRGGPLSLPWRIWPEKKTILKLKGLKDLEIVLSPHFWGKCSADTYLTLLVRCLRPNPTMQVLKVLCLRSLRISIEPQFDQKYIDGIHATFASRDETAITKKWLKYTELEMQFSRMVALGRDRKPFYGSRQDDPTSRARPWARGPEDLEVFRQVRTQEAKESQIKAELCTRIMDSGVRNGVRHVPWQQKWPFILSELEEIQEEAMLRRLREERLREERLRYYYGEEEEEDEWEEDEWEEDEWEEDEY
jgi:hypothetical protein